jgi:RNA polymerase sigma factor (sigma-70 family)
MDEVREFCRRVLGAGELAEEAAAQVGTETDGDRIAMLAEASHACRARAERDDGHQPSDSVQPSTTQTLAQSVARELEQATARLPQPQREALALRELMRLSHQQISQVVQIDQRAVAPLLAHARLGLRAERRGTPAGMEPCEHADRALTLLACRQDSEPLSGEDHEWLLTHVGQCKSCEMAHAAMLEASVCYRATVAT